MPSARPPAGLPVWGGRYAQRLTAATLARYGRTCHLCRQDGADSADHVRARHVSADDSIDNLRPAHQGCNSARGGMPLEQWFALHPVPRREALAPSRQW